jgi:hypothetical protein
MDDQNENTTVIACILYTAEIRLQVKAPDLSSSKSKYSRGLQNDTI